MTAIQDDYPVSVRVRVPGKVNLCLAVGPLRSDGYHDLATVFHAVSLYDEVTATEAEGLSISITGDSALEVPSDNRNLAWRAAAALAERAGINPDTHLTIRKGIPVAGGMAGGSADAAGALVACDSLWETGFSREELHEIAADLGSDVPFALYGGTAIGTGRGEEVMPVLARGEYHWVFAFAEGGLATPEVFATLDDMRARGLAPEPKRPPEVNRFLMAALRAGDPYEVGDQLVNDLQPPAFQLRPELVDAMQVGFNARAIGAVLSGSGPTWAFLARDAQDAVRIADVLTDSGACRAVRTAHGPVLGAHVIG